MMQNYCFSVDAQLTFLAKMLDIFDQRPQNHAFCQKSPSRCKKSPSRSDLPLDELAQWHTLTVDSVCLIDNAWRGTASGRTAVFGWGYRHNNRYLKTSPPLWERGGVRGWVWTHNRQQLAVAVPIIGLNDMLQTMHHARFCVMIVSQVCHRHLGGNGSILNYDKVTDFFKKTLKKSPTKIGETDIFTENSRVLG